MSALIVLSDIQTRAIDECKTLAVLQTVEFSITDVLLVDNYRILAIKWHKLSKLSVSVGRFIVFNHG